MTDNSTERIPVTPAAPVQGAPEQAQPRAATPPVPPPPAVYPQAPWSGPQNPNDHQVAGGYQNAGGYPNRDDRTQNYQPGAAFGVHGFAQPGGPGQGTGYPGGATQPTNRDRKPRRIWPAMVGTAAVAALLASGGTAATMTLLGNDTASSTTQTSIAGLGQGSPISVDSISEASWEAVVAQVAPSVVAIEVTTARGGAEGSGVIIDTEGHILTNDHVVSGAENDTVQVTLSDGRLYDATIVGLDPSTDLAVIKIVDPPSDLTAATFADSDQVVVGNAVMAVGNPLGLANSATTGIVSAVARPVTTSGDSSSTAVVTNAIQIDAAINPGNSGGPLFNSSGEVIGITSSIATLSSGSSQSGSIGLGFAIPANLASSIGQQLIDDGVAEHAFLGVTLTDGTATADGVTRRGAVVNEVTSGSPAADAGIRTGDVVVAIDGAPINGTESLVASVRERAAGEQTVLTIVRDGVASDVTVTLATRASDDAASGSSGQSGEPGQDGQNPSQEGQDGSGQELPGGLNPDDLPDSFFQWFEQQQGGQ